MSRSWSDTLVLTLMPDRVDVVRLRHFPSRRWLDREMRPCPARATADDWEGLLQVCAEVLSEPRWRTGRLRVVVSNALTRYAWLQWMDGLQGKAEEEALVRHRMDEIHGASAIASCEVRWDQEGAQRVACALPQHALSRLRELGQQHGTRLVSVQPLLVAAFNRYRNALRADAGSWFAVAEPGLLCIGRVDAQGWRSLRCARTPDAAADLPALVMRERILAGQELPAGIQDKVYVWSSRPWPAAGAGSGVRVIPLMPGPVRGFDSVGDADHAAALLGGAS